MVKKRVLFVMCSALLLAACNKDTSEEVKPVSAEPEEVEEAVEELPYTTPFTGEKVAEESLLRPILVTINNHPDARPQSGIASADVVYEMLAEGDVTRFLALYQSEIPTNIGPIRSARSYFVDIAKGLDAFYIAHGYSPEAKSMLTSGVIDNINGMNYDGTLFQRSNERRAPHNSYMPGENVTAAAEKVGASLLYQKKVLYSFYEEQDNVKIGTKANEVSISYSNSAFNSTYTYNAEENLYTRASAGEQTVDDLTGEPVQLSNVLFFEMSHRIIDNEGRRDIDITSGGTAYVAQQGMLREVRWENRDGLLVAIENDGSEMLLVPGQTWIHFVPTSPGIAASVSYSE
ncbi:DUF3048 domain-containing protein [Lysinibacillus odysseyi]|uniref:Lipoprotein YerB n=1 Tax=Lysinibacillus odysseyi 34hs-1 = NBRC 100172 TaxID=1220589 RepID=A0A0A3J0C5_9BACI|nr:DUF3048 domain-containing protein [Lysinibacillus odysseyi]KGR88613.1 hypothetical protein CD32_01395 [Lysinibacillus odysseyi 34hs-1 = NBRC 100172]